MKQRLRILVAVLWVGVGALHAAEPVTIGVPVSFQLPADGPLPRNYRATLAIVDPKNPDWIISQFARGVARTVTAENGGKFFQTWDGLDDNFMPVPPGEYAVRGIFMPARKWHVDQEWHSITPRFVGGASSWLPSPKQWDHPEPFGGDPVGAPLGDVDVGTNGVAVFYYTYLENGRNCPQIDLKKPLGYEQFVRAYGSGGAGGGTSVATDGETVWAFSTDGGPKYVYRADGKSFGKSPEANRANSYPPAGWVTAMAMSREQSERKLVCVAQRGKIIDKGHKHFVESDTEFVDKVTIHNGDDGQLVAELPLNRPRGLAARGGELFALHGEGDSFVVSAARLPDGAWNKLFAVPSDINPADLEVDAGGLFYLSVPAANKVWQLDRSGKRLRTYGKLAAQKPGSYDRETFMAPTKLATWRDPEGNDRLLVVESAGPNRVSEWSSDGRLLREFLSLQTRANDGYAVDPDHPEHIYLPTHGGWLTRFRVEEKNDQQTWIVDAVWPLTEHDPRSPLLDRAKLIRANGRIYFAGRRSFNVFRLDADRCALSAAILRERKDPSKPVTYSFWNDANGNARVDDDEVRPAEMPNGLMTYHGQNWLEDFSLVAVHQGGNDVWRLAPSGFDQHGNPIFKEWQRLFADPVFEARAAGKADALHGGNELAENFPSDWVGADGSMAEGFYVQARGGKNFSANEGPQHKLSRYVPDGQGGFRMKWRTGRTAMERLAEPGEFYGAMRVVKPINGLVSVIDQSRCGIELFTEDGLFVESIFPDGRRLSRQAAGLYPQPGEFFAGHVYANTTNGRVYFAMGKYTPLLYAADGWSLTENPVRALKSVQQSVVITSKQIASPPEIALSVRGGAGTAKLARFAPALGGAVLDGSLRGWESCEPVLFAADKQQTVEVRCLYDPEHLYLRWHARLGTKVEPKPLPALERVFTHDRLADTLSFYMQSDADAPARGSPAGRPGDVRVVFSLVKNGDKIEPVAIGFHPEWKSSGSAPARPQIYRTPVGQTEFAHVAAVSGAQLGHQLDDDGKGFVIVAALPRSLFPRLSQSFAGGLRTLVNFEATFGGHNKFWWANSDGSASRETYDEPTEARFSPGSWAMAQWQGLDSGVIVKNWLICGPFGGSGAEKLTFDPGGKMPGTDKDWKQATRDFCEAAAYPPDNGRVNLQDVFEGDLISGYWPKPGRVRWKPATIADLDTRVVLGPSGQVWYGATWLHVPEATELDVHFQGHPMTYLRWFLNSKSLKPVAKPETKGSKHPESTLTLKLARGWNQLHFRGYCIGYPPFRAGVILTGDEAKLWTVTLSAEPH